MNMLFSTSPRTYCISMKSVRLLCCCSLSLYCTLTHLIVFWLYNVKILAWPENAQHKNYSNFFAYTFIVIITGLFHISRYLPTHFIKCYFPHCLTIHFLLFHFSIPIPENRFICDCRLRWIFDLHNQTKNKELRYSLERISCTLEHNQQQQQQQQQAVNDPRYQVHFETNPRHVQPLDYDVSNDLSISANHIDQQHRKHPQGPTEKVELLNLKPNNLPCEVVADPTELPLQRESVSGYDLGKLFQSSAAAGPTIASTMYATAFLAVSVFYLW